MTTREQIRQLKEQVNLLRWENLKMRLHFEVLLDGTESKAAKKILGIYRSKRAKRDEASLSTQN